MKKIAYFDCYSGASGDMLLGSLLDKSVDFDWFLEEIKKIKLPQDSFQVKKSSVMRNAINSCKIDIILNHHDHTHRGYTTICNIIDSSDIAIKAKELSKKVFYKIAKAEADIHQKSIEDIHFHEVGAIDSILDIVGFCLCYTKLNIDKCVVSPLPTGTGKVYCAHGYIPVPAPAVLEILKDHQIAIKNEEAIHEECLTPTATAILCTIADECSYLPALDNIISIGYGAGSKTFDEPVISNLRFVIGQINEI